MPALSDLTLPFFERFVDAAVARGELPQNMKAALLEGTAFSPAPKAAPPVVYTATTVAPIEHKDFVQDYLDETIKKIADSMRIPPHFLR